MATDQLPALKGTPTPQDETRSFRLARFSVLLLLLTVLTTAGLFLYRSVSAMGLLHDAVAATYRADGPWRLTDLEARRVEVKEKENAALQVLAACKLLPTENLDTPQFRKQFEALTPTDRLDSSQAKVLRDKVARASAALVEAQKLKALPTGRFPTAHASNWIATTSHAREALAVANLLSWDVLLTLEDNGPDAALESWRGLLNCTRAIGEEPLTAAQLARITCRSALVEQLERILAQGEPSVDALLACQRLLEKEAGESAMRTALRGERAGCDWLMDRLETGGFPLAEALTGEETLLERLDLQHAGGVQRQHANLINFFNRAITVAGMSPHDQKKALRGLEQTTNGLPALSRRLLPPVSKLAAAEQHSVAQLRCVIVALAAERYRRLHGDWPASLAALVSARYFKEVPADPYNGAKLRWRRTGDGVVIYAVGLDGKDNGGVLNRQDPAAQGSDIGVRLWDSNQRRRSLPSQEATDDTQSTSPTQSPQERP